MNLYLYNQKRDRDLDEYLRKLCISQSEFDQLNQKDKRLLLVGGGCSLLKQSFSMQTVMAITNIDLAPPYNCDSERLLNIKGDFIEVKPYIDIFDEMWALYSLPLYSPDRKSVFMFLMRSILAIKSSGIIRFFPLEYDNSTKTNTRDADYDMTTMECTNSVLDALKIVNELGIKSTRVNLGGRDKNRVEEAVILTLDFSHEKKQEINSLILQKINAYNLIDNTVINVNVFLEE